MPMLAAYEQSGTTVSGPAEPVLLPGDRRRAVAAIAEALLNVERHAGPGARSWLLVDDDGVRVSVLIRDDGPGSHPAGSAEARRTGRLGVAGVDHRSDGRARGHRQHHLDTGRGHRDRAVRPPSRGDEGSR